MHQIKAALIAAALLTVFLSACAGLPKTKGGQAMNNVQRFGSVIGVKPEKLAYYKALHANPWPSVNKGVKDANIQNYSIYLTQFDDGKWYLFGYFEYTGNDLEADMAKLGEDSEIKRWWNETDPCQLPLDSREEGDWWKSMEEVYHLD